MAYKEKARELVSREAIEKEWFRLTQQTKEALRNIAPRLAGIVSAEKNQDRNFVTIEKEIEECQEALTD